MFLLLVYFTIALFFSFLCSVLEAVLLSITPSFVGAKKQEGSAYAFRLEQLKDDVDRPLAAILTLNTFAHTIGAAGVGAQAQRVWGEEYLSVTSAVLTIAILIFSEIIPKTLGATYWRHMAKPATYLLRMLVILLYPFVVISQLITRAIKRDDEVKVTRADFTAMAEISSREGALQDGEGRLIQNILRFSKVKVKDIMTPRNVMYAFSEDTLLKELRQDVSLDGFSRIPVYAENVDQITGYVLKDQVLMQLAGDQEQLRLKDMKREVLFVEEEMPVSTLFKKLINRREHIAIALEEYGGTAGVVTMEDIVETMLGLEIVDEQDQVADMQEYARKHARRKESAPAQETQDKQRGVQGRRR